MRVLAYLDPGSGSMLLQMLLGGIAGIAVSIKMFGKRIFRVLAFWKRHDEEEPASTTPAPAAQPTPARKAETEKEPV
jgi:hypothetical protein